MRVPDKEPDSLAQETLTLRMCVCVCCGVGEGAVERWGGGAGLRVGHGS